MTLLAEGVLKAHWDQTIPVNLAHIAKAMQITVALSELGSACARVELVPRRKPRIVIDRGQPLQRQRYGVAHALGHLALHHLRPGRAHTIEVSDSYHCDVQLRIDSEANDFALRLLMPEQALRQSLLDVPLVQLGQPGQQLEQLALRFQVAPILIKQRMADLGLDWPRTLAQQLRPETTWD